MSRTNLYTLQRNYNEACKPLNNESLRTRDCGYQDYAYEARQEAIEYHGEKLADHEQFLRDTLDLYKEAVFEVEFWEQMRAAATEVLGTADNYTAWKYLNNALKNLSYYEALIKCEMGNSLASLVDDINWETSHRCRSPRFHILEESDGFYSVFNDDDIPF